MPLALTRFQTDMLLGALIADKPEAASTLGLDTAGNRKPRIQQLITVGLLAAAPGGRHAKYIITDKGRAFAQVLAELEEAV